MGRYRGFSTFLTVVPQKFQQGRSEIYPGYAGVLIVQSPNLLILTSTFSIMAVGITSVYSFCKHLTK